MRIFFRKQLCESIESEVEDALLSTNGKLVLGGLTAMIAVLLAASAMRKDLGLPTCLAAVLLTTLVSLKARSNPLKLAKEISWPTLLLVAGLFVMADAIESQGALNITQAWLAWAQSLATPLGALVVGFVVGVGNNLVNNLPLGLIAGATIQAAHVKGILASAVLIGVDLGPNLSVTGSLATILWLLALRKEKVDAGFWKFLQVGAIAMPVGLVVALVGAIAMQMVTGQN
jgi:arsenical pump membrane protein